MAMRLSSLSPAVLVLSLGVAHLSAVAAPVSYEMNLRTLSGLGAGGMGGVMGMMFGSKPGASRSMDLRLTNPADLPPDYSASHQVPETMGIGPLLPLKGERRSGGQGGGSDGEADGRVLIYWGCGPVVAKGQPEILDFRTMAGKVSPEVMAMARQGRSMGKGGPGAGADGLPPRSLHWPAGDRDFKGLPDGASAVGEHVVKASFLTPDIRFTLGAAMDFLEPINLQAGNTNLRGAVPLSWDASTRVRGYDLNAVAANGDKEVVLWLAARNKSPMLPGSQRECTVPEGIFAKAEMAMVSAVAHGPSQGFAYPPQKPAEKKPLVWSAVVRVTGYDSLALGLEQAAGDAAVESAAPAGVGGLLKGIFGR